MSSVHLLDKTRKIGKFLHNNNSSKVVFTDICKIVSEIMDAHVLVISNKGKILGLGACKSLAAIPDLIDENVGGFIDESTNARLLAILSTKENVNLLTLGFDTAAAAKYSALVTPIEIAGGRLGTLFVYGDNTPHEIDDIILCEYTTTVISLEMLRSTNEENAELARKTASAKLAMDALNFSERNAIIQVFKELSGTECIVITSKIADRAGLTRSVIVSALRKFECAGVIEARSVGMKGTYIKIHNELIFAEVDRMMGREGS